MLAPAAASLFRYGACPLPITLERYLFSKITTTMWAGEAPALGLAAAERCMFDFALIRDNGRSAAARFRGVGCTTVPVSLGCATVEALPGYTGGGPAAPQAPQTIVKTPMTAKPTHRGKVRTWNPRLTKYLRKLH
jgi:hypothetical protein